MTEGFKRFKGLKGFKRFRRFRRVSVKTALNREPPTAQTSFGSKNG
jgi:hypothetical protein